MAEKKDTSSSLATEDTKALLRELIEANNRTNHAVRAIVLPSTILLVTVLIALPVIFLAVLTDSLWLMLLAAVGILVGAVLGIRAQISETRLSAVPSNPTQANRQAESSTTDTDQKDPQTAESAADSDDSRGKCRFCGKPFPPGYYDTCPDCGRN